MEPSPNQPGVPPSGAPRPPERRARLMGWRSQDVLRASALVIAMYLAIRLLWYAYPLVFTAFLGILFGLAVSSGVDRLERFRMPRGLAAALIVFGFLGALGGVLAWSAPTLHNQWRELRVKLPEAVDNVDRWLQSNRDGVLGTLISGSAAGDAPTSGSPSGGAAAGGQPGTPQVGAPAPTGGPPAAESRGGAPIAARPDPAPGEAGPATAPERQQRTAQSDAGAQNQSATSCDAAGGTLRQQIMCGLASARTFFFSFISSTFAAIAGFLLVTVLTIYVAAEPDLYHNGLMHLFPHGTRARAGEVLTVMASTLRRWLRTQLIAMTVIGVVTTIALFILGIPAAIPLGLLAGLLEFIPTIGPLLSAIPAVLMGFVISPEKALIVGIVYWGIQLAENYLLIPRLMREGMDLPPVLTIMAQALMALIFGFIGLLVAVPVLAAVMVAVKMLYVEGVVGDDVDVGDEGDG